MNKLLLSSTIAASILFSGCSRATAFDYFSTDSYYEKAVSNMQKASLLKDMETKALLSAVYLNPIDPDLYNGNEYFYIAVHILNDNKDPQKSGLKNTDYKLKIIEKIDVSAEDKTRKPNYAGFKEKQSKEIVRVKFDAIEIRELNENDRLVKTMPVRSQWNHFYLVKFKEIKDSTLSLSFESQEYGAVSINFSKDFESQDSESVDTEVEKEIVTSDVASSAIVEKPQEKPVSIKDAVPVENVSSSATITPQIEIALGGYDAIELSDGELVFGKEEYSHTHNKQVYYFESKDNAEEFYRNISEILPEAQSQWEILKNNKEE